MKPEGERMTEMRVADKEALPLICRLVDFSLVLWWSCENMITPRTMSFFEHYLQDNVNAGLRKASKAYCMFNHPMVRLLISLEEDLPSL